jgi:hypothetical protein
MALWGQRACRCQAPTPNPIIFHTATFSDPPFGTIRTRADTPWRVPTAPHTHFDTPSAPGEFSCEAIKKVESAYISKKTFIFAPNQEIFIKKK